MSGASRASILVVEDSRTQAAALMALLEPHFDVTLARSGEAALETALSAPFDLAISDVVMPGIDGFELCRRLKEQAGPRTLPVMLLTGQSDPIDIVRGLQAGADNYATKPYDPEHFLERVRRTLAEAGQRRPAAAGVSMSFQGETFVVSSDKEQILDLLTSSLEDLARTRVREQQSRTAAEAAARRFRFLAEAGAQLMLSLDPDETVRIAVRLAVPAVADLCLIVEEEAEGQGRCLASQARPELAAAIDALCGSGFRLRLPPSSGCHVAGEGADLASVCGPDLGARLRAVQVGSMVAVPFAPREGAAGALILASGRVAGRRLSEADLPLALDFARRVALALENARLYRAARDATRARDEMLGIIAHDLRNPLNNVSVSASLLRSLLQSSGDPAGLTRHVDVVLRGTRQADALIRDLLDVTRIDARRLELDVAPVESRLLIAEALDEMAPQAVAKSVSLVKTMPEGDAPVVQADRRRVLQVFANLIGNALKFTPAGGTVTVGAEVCGPDVVFSVSDTGPGLEPEHLPHVFDRFWQARATARLGTGLGLAIVKGIIEAQGGRVSVESAPGAGATFRFTLPAAGA